MARFLLFFAFICHVAKSSLAQEFRSHSDLEVNSDIIPVISKTSLKVEGYRFVGNVSLQQFDLTRPIADIINEIYVRRQPVVLRGSPVTSWRALTTWSPTYLAAIIPELKGVKRSSKPEFIYEEASRPFSMFTSKPAYQRVNLQTAEFFNTSPENVAFSYFSHKFKTGDEFEVLLNDISPLSFLTVDEGFPSAPIVNFWMGAPGARTHPHYDRPHNFFSQIAGRKRFLVASPSVFMTKGLHPILHPHDRQCPYISEAPSSIVDVLLAELIPGDLLYLPPMWLHDVTALGPEISISANVWSTGPEKMIMATLDDFGHNQFVIVMVVKIIFIIIIIPTISS